MKKIVENEAGTSRATLVAIVPLLIAQVTGDDFRAIKEKFPLKYADPDYLKNLEKEATDVNNMSLPESRKEPRIEARSQMTDMIVDVQDGALSLKAYIETGFASDKVAAMLEAMGYTAYYSRLNRKQFDVVDAFFNLMLAFMSNHNETLVSRGSMPEGFPAQMTALRSAFAALYARYKADNKKSTEETEHVVKAINALKAKVQGLCDDARLTFRKDKAKASTYTFEAFRQAAGPQRNFAAIRSGLVDSVSMRPIVGALISTPYFDLKTTTDKKGRFVIKPLPKGKYPLTMAMEGYETLLLLDVEVGTGIARTLPTMKMRKLLPGEGPSVRVVNLEEVAVPKTRKPRTQASQTAPPESKVAVPLPAPVVETAPPLPASEAPVTPDAV